MFNKLFTSILLILCTNLNIAAQEQKKVLLSDYLSAIEARFDLRFSFLEELVENNYITPSSSTLSLEEELNLLRRQTSLQFNHVNDRFIVINSANISANSICGYIIDSESNKPLPGAIASYQNTFTTSDTTGYFFLNDLLSLDTLKIMYIGYKTISLPITEMKRNGCITITLNIDNLILKNVLVTNYLTKGVNKINESTLQINNKTMGLLPGLTESDVLHTLQSFPGIQSINETVSHLNVNGGTNDQNLILWNGSKIYQAGHFFGTISLFNPHGVKNTTLIKNGTSAVYGDGISSTILIETDDNIVKKLSGSTGVNMLHGDFVLNIPTGKKSTLHLTGRRSYADMMITPTYKSYFERAFKNTEVINSSTTVQNLANSNQDFKLYDFSIGYVLKKSDSEKLKVSALTANNEIVFQENAVVNNIVRSKSSSLSQNSFIANVNYNKEFTERLYTEAFFSVSNYQLSAINADVYNNQEHHQKNEVLDFNAKFTLRKIINTQTDFLAGGQFNEVGIRQYDKVNVPQYKRDVKQVIKTQNVFGELNHIGKNKKLNTRLGMRLNYIDKFNLILVEPRLQASYLISDSWRAELSGEMKSQFTSQIIDLQTDFLGIDNRRWALSNNELFPVIKSKQLSLGMNYSKNELLFSVAAYYKIVEGINSQSQGFNNQFQWTSTVGGYVAEGFNVLFSKRMKYINYWLGYSFIDNNYAFPELIPPNFTSNFEIDHNISVGCNYDKNQWEFSIGINYHTGAPVTSVSEPPIIEQKINFDIPNTSELSYYLRGDISVKYGFKISTKLKAYLGVSVWNVLNRNNLVDYYYTIKENNVEPVKKSALYFTPNLVFRVFF